MRFLMLFFLLLFVSYCESSSGGDTKVNDNDTVQQNSDTTINTFDTTTNDTVQCQNECDFLSTKECTGDKTFKTCEDDNGCLKWSVEQTCEGTKVCKDGDCVDEASCDQAKACTTVGEKKCVGQNAVECKQNGNCLEWTVVDTCVGTKICVEGACTQQQGGQDDCVAISDCINTNCAQTDQACQNTCFQKGSTQGKADFNAYQQCGSQNCAQFYQQNKPAQGTQCVIQNCKDQMQKCQNFGTVGCAQFEQCLNGCGQNQTCMVGCVHKVSFDGYLAFVNINVCAEKNCASLSDNTCIQSKCSTEIQACQSN